MEDRFLIILFPISFFANYFTVVPKGDKNPVSWGPQPTVAVEFPCLSIYFVATFLEQETLRATVEAPRRRAWQPGVPPR